MLNVLYTDIRRQAQCSNHSVQLDHNANMIPITGLCMFTAKML